MLINSLLMGNNALVDVCKRAVYNFSTMTSRDVQLSAGARGAEALRKVIEPLGYGGQAKVARQIGVTPQTFNMWLKRGVPPRRAISVERALNGVVTRYDLRADYYPRDHLALSP